MKKLIVISLLCSVAFNTPLKAQESLNNIKFSIEKLVINDADITDSLKSIQITDKHWIEHNRRDVEIGKAEIVKNRDSEIHIKWISAVNGAEKDAITIYKYKKAGESYQFDVYFADKKRGYFIAKPN